MYVYSVIAVTGRSETLLHVLKGLRDHGALVLLHTCGDGCTILRKQTGETISSSVSEWVWYSKCARSFAIDRECGTVSWVHLPNLTQGQNTRCMLSRLPSATRFYLPTSSYHGEGYSRCFVMISGWSCLWSVSPLLSTPVEVALLNYPRIAHSTSK